MTSYFGCFALLRVLSKPTLNHSLLFEKLRSGGTPTCFIRLLKHWYSTQTMRVRWANYVSEAFTVSNGERQGGALSPYLFFVYMDDLSDKLNNTDAGRCIGDLTLNYITYADDFCCLAASAGGLQDLLDVCNNYAKLHDIVFNCKNDC